MKTKKHREDPVNPIQKQRVKIAVPLFNDRISPHFGASSTFLLVETDGKTISREATWNVPGEGPMEIARNIVALGVKEMICGGIQNQNKEWLMAKGIMVLDNQKGVAREIVRTHLESVSDHVNLSPSAE
ncbi:MAG: NifB/NifX family molybdenum-iron cluster-binding protein [Deltaproteobacteria bacterium]|nr:NifB/NifX family molybdenum-iron cluster-binding protein [Deltaproteobacteria bacterium]